MNKHYSEDKDLLQAKEFLDNMLALLDKEEKRQLLENLLVITKNL